MIDAKAFWKKTLDLAIRGKLVPQDPKDEPAAVLLERIKEEKKKLVEEGKIKPEKTESIIFRGSDNLYYETVGNQTRNIQEEIPFEIPDNWVWTRLGNISNYGSCMSVDSDKIANDDWVLDLEDIEKDSGILLRRVLKKDRPCLSSKHFFEPGNVLYSKLRTYLNKVLVADQYGYCTSEIIPIDFGKNVSPQYARFLLMSPMTLEYTARCVYGMKMPRLGTNDGKRALFPLPPLLEQKRIVEKLEKISAQVNAIDAESKKLEVLATRSKNKILDLAIRGKLVPQDPKDEPAAVLLERIKEEKKKLVEEGKIKKEKPLPKIDDDEKPFEIPGNWVWVSLGEILTIKGGKRIPQGYNCTDVPTKHIYIRVTDMKNHTILSTGLRYISEEVFEKIKTYTISKDDLYLTIAGTIGNVGFVPEMFDGMNLTENAVKLTDILIDKNYLVYNLSSDFVQCQFKAKTNQVTQPKLAIERIQTTLIPLPPLSEQKRIVEKLEELLPLYERLTGVR